MTIDDAIEFSRYKATHPSDAILDYGYNDEEHSQLVEWLEELKGYQAQHNRICEFHDVATVEDIYNKAIDDFITKCVSCGIVGLCTFHDMSLIAEQLKVGGNNEN